jgi:quercetin dioxygenase-like cupin family protein
MTMNQPEEERPMKKLRRKPITVAVALCATATVAAAAYGTAGGGFTATLFTRDTMSNPVHVNGDRIKFETKDASDFASQTITYTPGGFSGWHRHPGLVLVMVKAGQVTRYLAPDCHSITYSAGQAFIEAADDPVMQIRNEGTTDAVLYVAYVVPKESPLRLDSPAPACAQ